MRNHLSHQIPRRGKSSKRKQKIRQQIPKAQKGVHSKLLTGMGEEVNLKDVSNRNAWLIMCANEEMWIQLNIDELTNSSGNDEQQHLQSSLSWPIWVNPPEVVALEV